LNFFDVFISGLMLGYRVAAIIVIPIIGGTLKLLSNCRVQIASYVPTSKSACADPNQWPQIDNRDLFSIVGGNITAPASASKMCSDLKNLQYWGTTLMYVHSHSLLNRQDIDSVSATNIFCFASCFVIGIIVPPVYSTASVLYQAVRYRYHRASLKPSANLSQMSITSLCRATCSTAERECWSCARQVCDECASERLLQASHHTQHLVNCVPYCVWCYWRWLCSRTCFDLHSPKGKCRGHERHDEEGSKLPSKDKGKPVSTPKNGVQQRILICQACAELENEEIYDMFERREIDAIAALAHRFRCEVCARSLSGKNEICWWVCKTCLAVCWWKWHQ
jgi:hypothetical protein